MKAHFNEMAEAMANESALDISYVDHDGGTSPLYLSLPFLLRCANVP